MTRASILLLQLFIVSFTSLMSQSSNDIIGIWKTKDGKSKVEILKNESNQTFSGKIIWLKTPLIDGEPRKDENGNLVLGLDILKDFRFDSDEWEGGTIYDPESGNTYYCTLTLQSENKLEVHGSVDPMGWIGRKENWHRVIEK